MGTSRRFRIALRGPQQPHRDHKRLAENIVHGHHQEAGHTPIQLCPRRLNAIVRRISDERLLIRPLPKDPSRSSLSKTM